MGHYAQAGLNSGTAHAWCECGWSEDHGSLEEAERAAREHQVDASEDHRIEEAVQVYLVLRDGRWAVDRTTVDGYPLDPVHVNGATAEECDCDDQQACEAAQRTADEIVLPTGHELHQLLAEAITEWA